MLIVADKPGQLGNRLLVFANVIAASIRLGSRVVNPAFDEYAPLFRGTRRNPLCAFPPLRGYSPRWFRRLIYLVCLRLVSGLVRIRPTTRFWHVVRLEWGDRLDMSSKPFEENAKRPFVFLQGWLLRDVTGLTRHREEICEYFRPPPAEEELIAERIAVLRARYDAIVGVHIRQGDYNVDLGRLFFRQTTDFLPVMRGLQSLMAPRRVGFIIASNVLQDLSSFPGLTVERAFDHAIRDLYLLASCDYIIGSPSSFAFWASFFGQVPMFVLTDAAAEIRLEDATVFPDVIDPTVRSLYLGE